MQLSLTDLSELAKTPAFCKLNSINPPTLRMYLLRLNTIKSLHIWSQLKASFIRQFLQEKFGLLKKAVCLQIWIINRIEY